MDSYFMCTPLEKNTTAFMSPVNKSVVVIRTVLQKCLEFGNINYDNGTNLCYEKSVYAMK